MQYVTDLHLHSKYSRAVSQNMILSTMSDVAAKKGLDILSVSDWTHPLWLKEVRGQIEEAGSGMYTLKADTKEKKTLFLFSTEISSIYKHKEKLRRIHNLIFAPSITSAENISKALLKKGCNLSADGRPIIGLSSKALLALILEIDDKAMLIPCHVWTPHFGVYGSKSGYDSLEECFEDLSPYVYGIETGISSDPKMNWRIKELANRSILSFSDAHSPANMAREATAFELKTADYDSLRLAIMQKGGLTNRILYTLEFFPEEGKYHYSGHRNCGVSLDTQQIQEQGNMCPHCKRVLTEGVLPRIEQLAGPDPAPFYAEKMNATGLKWYIDTTRHHPPFVKLVRLVQIIAEGLGTTPTSMKTQNMYETLCHRLGPEITILLKTPFEEIEKITGEKIAEGVRRVRSGNITIDPGFDGEYGVVHIWGTEKQEEKRGKSS